jgi:chemotaxis regulatin CheY-phosphate phosphatase CheZ
MIARLWRKITQDKEEYNSALAGYKTIRNAFNSKRNALIERLSQDKFDMMLNHNKRELTDSWTTIGLHQSMNKIFTSINEEFDRIQKMSEDIHSVMKRAYKTFEKKFNFPAVDFPGLNLENHRLKLKLLARETEAFCKDPINVMTEKRFLIRKFHDSLISEARAIFVNAGEDCARWTKNVVTPLENQLRDHKAQLQQRLDSLTKINQDSSAIQGRLTSLKEELKQLMQQKEIVNRLLVKLKFAEPQAVAA